jgi:hypothetical protein
VDVALHDRPALTEVLGILVACAVVLTLLAKMDNEAAREYAARAQKALALQAAAAPKPEQARQVAVTDRQARTESLGARGPISIPVGAAWSPGTSATVAHTHSDPKPPPVASAALRRIVGPTAAADSAATKVPVKAGAPQGAGAGRPPPPPPPPPPPAARPGATARATVVHPARDDGGMRADAVRRRRRHPQPLALSAAALLALAAPAAAQETVALCHATGDPAAPYVLVRADAEGLAGHLEHPDDIVPAPDAGCPGPEPQPAETPADDAYALPTATPTRPPRDIVPRPASRPRSRRVVAPANAEPLAATAPSITLASRPLADTGSNPWRTGMLGLGLLLGGGGLRLLLLSRRPSA